MQLGAPVPSKPLEALFAPHLMALDRSEQLSADLDLIEDDGAQEFWAALARETDEDLCSISPPADESLSEDWLALLVDEPPLGETRAAHRQTGALNRPRRDARCLDSRERFAPPIRRVSMRRTARRLPIRPPTSRFSTSRKAAGSRRGLSVRGGAVVGGLLGVLASVLLGVFTPAQRSPSTSDAAAPPLPASALSRDRRDGASRGRPIRAVRQRTDRQRPTRQRAQARMARLPVTAPRASAPRPVSVPELETSPALAPSSSCCASSPSSSQGGGGADGRDGQGDGGGDGGSGGGGQEFGFER